MKILVTKTSDWNYEEEREYESLEVCVNTILRSDYFKNNSPEVVVAKTKDSYLNKSHPDCEYVVEIYDTYRE